MILTCVKAAAWRCRATRARPWWWPTKSAKKTKSPTRCWRKACPWADRLALTLINRGQVQADDFDLREGGGVALQGDARKAVVVAYQERKKDEITHPLLAQTLPLGLAPLMQARLLARALRDDAMPYLPFVPK